MQHGMRDLLEIQADLAESYQSLSRRIGRPPSRIRGQSVPGTTDGEKHDMHLLNNVLRLE